MKKGNKIIYVSNKKDMMEEWNWSKNTIDPNKIGCGSYKMVWWKCKICNNEWETSPLRRSQGYRTCLKCNSLGSKNINLSKEWNNLKNGNLTPFDVSPKTSKKVWWEHTINGEKHEWIAGIKERNRGNGCPYCSGHLVSKDNCLVDNLPQIAKEWHNTKNGNVKSNEVSVGSNFMAWWECSKCHYEWKTEVYHRNDGNGCPKCSANHRVSLIDGMHCDSKTEAYYYLIFKDCGTDFIHDGKYDKNKKYRYDFYFPICNLYLEVTGYNAKEWKNGKWFKYLRKIVKKKNYVEKILKARFEFIQHSLSKSEKEFVEQHIIKN